MRNCESKNSLVLVMGEKTNGESLESCYRNTGSVPVPRKISKSSPSSVPLGPSRKISAPAVSPAQVGAAVRRKASCPVTASQRTHHQPVLNLLTAALVEERREEETARDFSPSEAPDSPTTVSCSVVKASSAALSVKVNNKPKIQTATEKAVTSQAEVKTELKRGSMRDKWGLGLTYNIQGGRIRLSVVKVSMFSPAAKAGLGVGDTIITINDWNIEAMENIQAVINIFLAAGFSVSLGWSRPGTAQAMEETCHSLDLI